MDKNNLVAAKIRETRDRKNILQKQVADALKLSTNAYSRVEGGYTQITINTLYIIAEVLETNIEELLGINSKTANNYNNVVMSQFNDGTVNINFSPQEFKEMYKIVEAKLSNIK